MEDLFLQSETSIELPCINKVLTLPEGFDDVLTKVLQFLYTIAHWIGLVIAKIIHSILPSVKIPNDLVESIGLLAMLTIFLVVMQIAKKLTWIVVVIGWLLVLVRVALITIQG